MDKAKVREHLDKIQELADTIGFAVLILDMEVVISSPAMSSMERLDGMVEKLRLHKEALWNLLDDEEEEKE